MERWQGCGKWQIDVKKQRKGVKKKKKIKSDVDALMFDGDVLKGAVDALNDDGNVLKGDREALNGDKKALDGDGKAVKGVRSR